MLQERSTRLHLAEHFHIDEREASCWESIVLSFASVAGESCRYVLVTAERGRVSQAFEVSHSWKPDLAQVIRHDDLGAILYLERIWAMDCQTVTSCTPRPARTLAHSGKSSS